MNIAIPRELLIELAHCVQVGQALDSIKDLDKRKAAKCRCEDVWTKSMKILHPGQLKGGK